MPRTSFRSEIDGFAFTNSWQFDKQELATIEQILSDAIGVVEVVLAPLIAVAEGPVFAAELAVPFIGPWLVAKTIEAENNAIINGILNALDGKTYGRCGGMAFAACDYWHKQWIVPRGNGMSDQPTNATPQSEALRDYIWNRLLDSLKANAGKFLEYMAILHFDSSGGSTLRDKTKAEVANLKAAINARRPVTIGLVGTTWNPFDNHQVLAYGYEDHPNGTTTLFIYDNNAPDTESTTTLDFSGSELKAVESIDYASTSRGPLRGLFCTAYTPMTPPRAVVLRQGLTVSPAVTGEGDPVKVHMMAANVGYHDSPAFSMVIAGDAGPPVQEAAMTSIPEGGTRSLDGTLSFANPGNHKIGAVVSLKAKDGTTLVRFLPPEGSTQNPSGQVDIVIDRLIDFDADFVCEVGNTAGGTVDFKVRVDDMGPNLTYQWMASSGTTIVGDSKSQVVQVKLPAQVGATVTLTVTVTRPDGGHSGGSCTFKTVSQMAAGLQQVMCEISQIITKAPFQIDPSDPAPDGSRVIDPGEILTVANAAAKLAETANAAARLGQPLQLSRIPAAQLTVAVGKVAVDVAPSTPILKTPVIANVLR